MYGPFNYEAYHQSVDCVVTFVQLHLLQEEKNSLWDKLIFTHDDYGPAAEYHLTTQFTNRSGRAVSGISLFFDANDGLISNAELNCEKGRPALQPGSTGQCSTLLQTIDGKMMEKFGTTMWTDIVNIQLQR